MSCIDAGVVQQMFGDDIPMFQALLARVLRELGDLALAICVSPDDLTARTESKLRAHKLKDSTGMIGATKVMRLAGAAEVALDEERAAEFVEDVLRQLPRSLTTLRDEAQLFLQRP
jgi:HPt (histidine-containing phosphotransfer) domain-containing protein